MEKAGTKREVVALQECLTRIGIELDGPALSAMSIFSCILLMPLNNTHHLNYYKALAF